MSVTTPLSNSVTQEQINSVFAWVTQQAQPGIDFAKEQAPLLANEIIQWGIVSSLFAIGIWSLIWLVSVIICGCFWRKSYKTYIKPTDFVEGGCFFSSIIAIALTATMIPVLAINGSELLRAWFTPRLYLLQEISKLINGH